MHIKGIRESDWFLSFLMVWFGWTLAGLIVGGIGGVLTWMVLQGASQDTVAAAGAVIGFILSLPVQYFLLRFIVAKFIIPKLEPVHEPSTEPIARL